MADPEETKTLITSVLTSTPLVMTIGMLKRDFKEIAGYDIPYAHFGFKSLEHYLRSIPDTVQINGHGTGAEVKVVVKEKSAHINDLISKQRKPRTRRMLRSNIRNKAAFRQSHFQHNTFNSAYFHLPIYLPRALPQALMPPHFENNNHCRYKPNNVIQRPSPSANIAPRDIKTNGVPKTVERVMCCSTNSTQSKQASSTTQRLTPNTYTANKIINDEIQKIIHSNTDCSASSIPSRQQKNMPAATPPIPQKTEAFKTFNFLHTNKYLNTEVLPPASSSLIEEPTTPEPDLPSYLLKRRIKLVAPPQIPVRNEDIFESDDDEDRVPEEVQNNLKDLIKKNPKGIWCCDLPNLYIKRYGHELDYTSYGFRTLNEMCIYLSGIFHHHRPNKGDFMLYDRTKPIPKDSLVAPEPILDHTKTTDAIDSPIPNIEELCINLPLDIPEDVVRYREEIPRQWITEDTEVGSCIDVCVGEVYDPSKFWFITRGKELDELMDEMQIFYKQNCETLVIPEHHLKEGLYCAAIFLKEYHRAIVIDTMLPTKNMVKVFFFDYGTVAPIPSKGICYLHVTFSKLPQQAMRGRLSHTYPIGKSCQWEREVSHRFLQLVELRDLIARVDKIDEVKEILYLVLIEPKGSPDRDIVINDVLVREKLAVSKLKVPEHKKRNLNTKDVLKLLYQCEND